MHYEEVTLLGTYHHAPRYIAQALEILARREHPWADLLGPAITLDQLPDALAGRLHDPRPAKYAVSMANEIIPIGMVVFVLTISNSDRLRYFEGVHS